MAHEHSHASSHASSRSASPRRLAIVTGASSGIGRATALALSSDATLRVIGTSRNPGDCREPFDMLPLDLADPDSIASFAESVLAMGTPTVLVNNAGESQSGPFEELPRAALERLLQTNVLGQVELTQKLLPAMREAGYGRIVMVGSMLGSFPLAYRSSYVASKAALKGFAFSLRREVAPFGVGVSVVEPGSINTGLSQRRTKYANLEGPYGAEFSTMLDHLDANEARGISPERVAREILKAIEAPKTPRPLYAVGSMPPLVFPLARVLPTAWMHRIINRKHGL